MSIKTIQKEIEKYYSLIKNIEDKISEKENKVLDEIIKCAKITNFFEVHLNDKKEYIYFSYQCIDNPWNIVGVKIDNIREKIKYNNIDISYVKNAKKIESITPNIFFKYALKYNIQWNVSQVLKECLLHKPKMNDENLVESVGYCRLSKSGSKHNYQRQMSIINNKCKFNNNFIDLFFCETLSGDTPFKERKEINKLLTYCNANDIDTIYVSEFNRLGRNTKTIMDGIKYLRSKGINNIVSVLENIHINESYITNNYRELKQLCVKTEEDRCNIVNRMRSGLSSYISNNGKLGRKVGYRKNNEQYLQDYKKEINLLSQNMSLRKINTITGTSINALRKIKKVMIEEGIV